MASRSMKRRSASLIARETTMRSHPHLLERLFIKLTGDKGMTFVYVNGGGNTKEKYFVTHENYMKLEQPPMLIHLCIISGYLYSFCMVV